MATVTFSTLPVEIHQIIASHCGNSDLFHLCLTSKWVNERCLHLLYRHVDLQINRHRLDLMDPEEYLPVIDAHAKRQQQLASALLTHPEYCKQVRSLTAKFCGRSVIHSHKDSLVQDELWRAMQSLTHVRSVDIGTIEPWVDRRNLPAQSSSDSSRTDTTYPYRAEYPKDLFRSATSVRLVGEMKYRLAMSILNAINPATLKHLCLDLLRYQMLDRPDNKTLDLLETLIGRCTALRTLILRIFYRQANPEVSYTACASFIRSVQGTVEKFTFEQAFKSRSAHPDDAVPFMMDERFRRLILPAIVSGNWPRLTNIELRRGRNPNRQGGNAALTAELRAALGGNTNIVVEEEGCCDDYDL